MKIYPSREKASHFNLEGLSVQEIRNFIELLEAEGPPYIKNSPWARGMANQMKEALAAERQYHYGGGW